MVKRGGVRLKSALGILGLILAAVLAGGTPAPPVEDPDQASDLTSLREAFVHPPENSKIMTRWWWFGPAVSPDELEREMRLMKAGGIGGFEVQPVYPLALDDPSRGFKNDLFLSDAFIQALRCAFTNPPKCPARDLRHAPSVGERVAIRSAGGEPGERSQFVSDRSLKIEFQGELHLPRI